MNTWDRRHPAGIWGRRHLAGKGFTLIEVLVSAGIASVVLLVGFYAITTTITTSRETTQRIRDTENARLFFQMLERDLASATPGPGPLRKGILTSPTFVLADRSSTVLLTQRPSVTPFDTLQFYCRSDEQATLSEDSLLFVRYYTNFAAGVHSLCRAVRPYTDINNPPHADDTQNPYDMANRADFSNALFSNVRNMTVIFQRWDPAQKRYVKADPASQNEIAQCDSVLVSIVFTNEFAENLLNNNSARTQGTYEDRLNKTYRSYSKILQLPASLK